MTSISNTSSTVKMILEKWPDTRDNDNLLLLYVWLQDNPNLKSLSFMEFAKLFKEGNFTSSEAIRRTRQLTQQNFPHLRGLKYETRRKHQAKVLEELREPNLYQGGTP